MTEPQREQLADMMLNQAKAMFTDRKVSRERIMDIILDRAGFYDDEGINFEADDDELDDLVQEYELTFPEKQIYHTLNALVEGLAEDDKPFAKDVLRLMLDFSPRNTWQITLPIARRLMCFDGWQANLIVADVIAYCLKRQDAVELLRGWRDTDMDVEAELLGGMAEQLHSILW
jgi:hypothetical protein